MMKECYAQAKQLLEENKEVLKEIAEFLCEKESITGKEFLEIYNRLTGKNIKTAEEKEAEKKAQEAETAAEESAKEAETVEAPQEDENV